MLKIYETEMSDKGARLVSGTREDMYEQLMDNAYPALYIETETTLSCSDGIIVTEYGNVLLSGKTLLAVAIELQDLTISAYITSDSIAMMPAELLLSYSNKIIKTTDIDKSPTPLTELHSKEIINIPGLEESYISRDVKAVVSASLADNEHPGDVYNEYLVDDGNLYVENLTFDTKCLYEYRAKNFFLFISDRAVIDLNNMLSVDEDSASGKILIKSINAINTDKL